MAVVTIFDEVGTAGSEIASLLAERLRYRYVSRDVIDDMARRLRITGLHLAQTASHVRRIPGVHAEARIDRASRRAALCLFAEEDDVVLMDGGAGSILRDVPHVLRVAVVTPFEVRVERLIERLAPPDGQAAAVPGSSRGDVGGAEAPGMRRLRGSLGLRSCYDVTINGTRVDATDAADHLSDLLRHPQRTTTEAGRRRVRDLSLASRVELALTMNARTERYRIDVRAVDGVVRLDAPDILDEAIEVAREVTGVRRVVMRVVPTPTARMAG